MASFRFGKNWQSFNRTYLNRERLDLAKKSITDFLGVTTLEGKTFGDIGAGSGIDSLVALELGAKDVYSMDIDQDCIDCCLQLKETKGSPSNWTIAPPFSILDYAAVSKLPQFDIVYSWGVLHHTGSMWKAIENSMKLVKPGGVFYLAIYNKADGLAIYHDLRFGPSWFWHMEKRLYVSMPTFLQNFVDYCVMGVLFVGYLLTLRNPFAEIRRHKYYFNKGMAWRIDIKDWLGGYPYEYATVAEIFHFAKQRGFSLENLTCNNGLLNNEFLLRKTP